MGKLKPGATYIYERVDGTTYAREFGATERTPIGWDYSANTDLQQYQGALWRDVLKEAEFNPSLHQAIERVILLYKLSKEKLDGQ